MQKIAPKILLTSFLSLFLLVGAGCKPVGKNNTNSILQRSPTSSVQTATSTSNDDASVKKFTIQGFAMTVPDKYSVVKVENTKAWVKTDDKKYDVKLVLEITPMSTVEFKKATAGLTPDAVLKNGSVYKDGCSGFGCYNVMVGDKAFAVQSGIESNEKPPLNLDGVWSPSSAATSEDLLSILKTAEVK